MIRSFVDFVVLRSIEVLRIMFFPLSYAAGCTTTAAAAAVDEEDLPVQSNLFTNGC